MVKILILNIIRDLDSISSITYYLVDKSNLDLSTK